MNRTHREILQRHSYTLTTRLTLDENFIRLCEAMSLITPAMKISIMAEKSDSEKTSRLLDYLRRGGPNTFRTFVYVLQQTERGWLACKLNNAVEIANAEGEMSPERTAKLQQCRQEITIIPLDTIWDEVDHIFSPDEEVQIKKTERRLFICAKLTITPIYRTQSSNEMKMATLLYILSSKSDMAFDHLVRALRTVKPELAGRLEHGAHEEERRPENQEISNTPITDSTEDEELVHRPEKVLEAARIQRISTELLRFSHAEIMNTRQ
ncbi:hypothetical protein C0Q70_08029 [Pomacea canaliculata]|uniref:CARD domain-containing protein n=1 Tax=Pomacea canaliculata TaxID=400727 RepID=A0A2T7PGQ7_POMCA|nr:hypothetical protein C0Q70_08029 [Pomacea canaliculata]